MAFTSNSFLDMIHDGYYKTESKIKEIVDGNFVFVLNLRKHLASETNTAKSILIDRCVYVSLAFTTIVLVLTHFGYKSILGTIPELLSTVVFLVIKLTFKLRRKNSHGS